MGVVAKKRPRLVNVREGLIGTGRSVEQTYPRASGGKWGFQSSVGF